MSNQDHLELSELHRLVLRRLVELSGDHRGLVTPSQLVSEGWTEPDGRVGPVGVQPPYLVKALDDLVGSQFAERIVPTAGESSYRPTEVGCLRLTDLDN